MPTQPSEKEESREESGSLVEALKLEMQKLQERKADKERELRELANFQTQEVSIDQRIIGLLPILSG